MLLTASLGVPLCLRASKFQQTYNLDIMYAIETKDLSFNYKETLLEPDCVNRSVYGHLGKMERVKKQ